MPTDDGDTQLCPKCGKWFVFRSRYPIALIPEPHPLSKGAKFWPAWVCQNPQCKYVEAVDPQTIG